MRTLRLYHPKGHPYWNAGQFNIQLPDGTFYNKKQHNEDPESEFCDSHKIIVKQDGIYFQKCAASSGSGKTAYGTQFKIVDSTNYDRIEFVGDPLVMSENLLNEIAELENDNL